MRKFLSLFDRLLDVIVYFRDLIRERSMRCNVHVSVNRCVEVVGKSTLSSYERRLREHLLYLSIIVF